MQLYDVENIYTILTVILIYYAIRLACPKRSVGRNNFILVLVEKDHPVPDSTTSYEASCIFENSKWPRCIFPFGWVGLWKPLSTAIIKITQFPILSKFSARGAWSFDVLARDKFHVERRAGPFISDIFIRSESPRAMKQIDQLRFSFVFLAFCFAFFFFFFVLFYNTRFTLASQSVGLQRRGAAASAVYAN